MTNVSEEAGYDKEYVYQRQEEIKAVASAYRFLSIFKLDFPTRRLDLVPMQDMISEVSKVIHKTKPDVIFLPYSSDVHSDHRITFDVVISAAKSFKCPFVKKILAYEVLSETEFSATFGYSTFIQMSSLI